MIRSTSAGSSARRAGTCGGDAGCQDGGRLAAVNVPGRTRRVRLVRGEGTRRVHLVRGEGGGGGGSRGCDLAKEEDDLLEGPLEELRFEALQERDAQLQPPHPAVSAGSARTHGRAVGCHARGRRGAGARRAARGGGAAVGRGGQGLLWCSPPPPPRTKWTRRVPHPVLIGHAASSPGPGRVGGRLKGEREALDKEDIPHAEREVKREPVPVRPPAEGQRRCRRAAVAREPHASGRATAHRRLFAVRSPGAEPPFSGGGGGWARTQRA